MTSGDNQFILDHFRTIVKSLRDAAQVSEKMAGVSAAQLFVLQKISESGVHPLSINDLAERTLTHQSSVSVVVSKLIKAKLVERTPSLTDARVSEVRLTVTGKKLVNKGAPLIQQKLIDGIQKLSISERRGLVNGLNALVEKAGLHELEPSLFFEETEKKKRVNSKNGK
jgi:DNA-binding MarR family transcriptional regulator